MNLKEMWQLWKEDRPSFWKEFKSLFFFFAKQTLVLARPVKKFQQERAVKKSLMSHSFYFLHPLSYQIFSPLSGFVEKIYLDNTTIHLRGERGLQIILTINFKKDQNFSVFDAVKCQVQEKQKVEVGSLLFLIYLEKQISSVVVFVPWQPWILSKVNKFPFLGKGFARLHYRNPWKKVKIKRHGEY